MDPKTTFSLLRSEFSPIGFTHPNMSTQALLACAVPNIAG